MVIAEVEDFVPSWLDKAFIEEILSADESCAISVSEFSAINAVGKGDNYASLLLRVNVQYLQGEAKDIKETSLIVKSLPQGELIQTWVINIGAFAKEERMYRDTLPAMSRLLREKTPQESSLGVGTRSFNCARPYTLVLEDLKQQGFRMANRHNQLDLSHALLVLNTLGRFHGASVALHIQDPEHMNSYQETMYVESQRETLDSFMIPLIDNLGNAVSTWAGFEKYGDKLKQWAPNVTSLTIDVVKPKEGSLSVLNHGDCWVNNSLYKYNDQTGEVEDVRFIDFQLARFTSPVLDLIYFLYSSVQYSVLMECFEEMLEAYHNSLGTTLRLLGCEDRLLSMAELKKEFEEREAFGLIVVCSILCAVLADPSDAPDMTELTEEKMKSPDTNLMGKMYEGKRFKDAFQKMLPLFVEKGIL